LDPDQLELWRRVNELWELAARKDDHGIRDALHPDYVGWDMSAPLPHDRDAAVQSASGDSPRLTRYALEPLSVRVYEGNVGVVHYRYEATVEPQPAEATRVAGKWTEVYARKERRWLMVAVSGQPNRTTAPDGGPV
jgi:hypothetical protein